MRDGTNNSLPALKVTGLIVPAATVAGSRENTPRRPWGLKWRMLAGEAALAVERACRGLFRVGGYDRHGKAIKIRINLWHPMAPPVCCIFLAALPFLALWAAIVPALRWHDRRDALRHNTEMLRNRS